MEILAIGEKIKRSRIYKGYTLKDICGDEISVSKMSCIENGKIEPEEWILNLVSQKLELPLDYLTQDVKYQLMFNLKDIKENCSGDEKKNGLRYNFEYAEEYHYYDIAFEIMHLLFSEYIAENDANACFESTPKYYSLFIKSTNEENKLIYYMDIGKYFLLIKEYMQAANYFNNVRKSIEENKFKDKKQLAAAYYEEAKCYFMIKNYAKAYELIEIFNSDLIGDFENPCEKAKVYNLFALLCIYLKKADYLQYVKKSEKFCKDNLRLKAEILYSYGQAFLEIKEEKEAFKHIKEAEKIFPQDDKVDFVKFMIKVIERLIEMNKKQESEKLCNTILDIAIDIGENLYIERAYYFKALLTDNSEDFAVREMYMNLSLDMLLKNGSREQIYNRYMEMGNMYFKMKNSEEALKYFGLAINLDRHNL